MGIRPRPKGWNLTVICEKISRWKSTDISGENVASIFMLEHLDKANAGYFLKLFSTLKMETYYSTET
jgi:hypothetical protein